ncbi:MAG: AAA family ATPase [Spirochaetales bacterium]|nr:AAA family ATPase [Leptospiraceae bacterium]MCP5481110.1 AAA family ATPase [Spirochaetales bacterium]
MQAGRRRSKLGGVEPGLDEIVAFFQRHPERLNSGETEFERVETHISVVLIGRQRVYKFKKAVNLGFIDQTELEERRRNCKRELELNRRLAPDVYLRVLGICAAGGEDQGFVVQAAEGPGVLEYCVEMQTLPAEKTLLAMLGESGSLSDRRLSRETLRCLARHLSDFHDRVRVPGSRIRSGRFFQAYNGVLENIASREQVRDLLPGLKARLGKHKRALGSRERKGFVVEGHGDLRLDHIYLRSECEFAIIDCVEFDENLRLVDPWEDLAFTTMGLTVEGHPELARELADRYLEWTADIVGWLLLPIYEEYRASVRVLVDLFQLSRPGADRERLNNRITRYADFLRKRSVRNKIPPSRKMILLSGLPATGKSRVAERLGEKNEAPVIATDIVRKRMAGRHPLEDLSNAHQTGMYKPGVSRRVYRRCRAIALLLLKNGRNVVVDGTFGRRGERRLFKSAAESLNPPAVASLCLVSEERETVLKRLRERQNQPGVSDLKNIDIWDRIAARFEAPSPDEGFRMVEPGSAFDYEN